MFSLPLKSRIHLGPDIEIEQGSVDPTHVDHKVVPGVVMPEIKQAQDLYQKAVGEKEEYIGQQLVGGFRAFFFSQQSNTIDQSLNGSKAEDYGNKGVL